MRQHIDDIIRNFLMTRLTRDHRIKAGSIDVIVKNGTVTLKGNAADPLSIRIAGEAALNMPGVYQVKNDLKIDLPAGRVASPLLIPGTRDGSNLAMDIRGMRTGDPQVRLSGPASTTRG